MIPEEEGLSMDQQCEITVEKCIQLLASACDHAQARDAIGFSKSTAGPGHEIAALGARRWTKDIWAYAGRLAVHHANQLVRTGKITEDERELVVSSTPPGSTKAPTIVTNWVDVAGSAEQTFLVVSCSPRCTLGRIFAKLPGDQVYQPAGAGRLWRISLQWAFVVGDHMTSMDVYQPAVFDVVARSRAAATNEMCLLAHDGPVLDLSPDGSKATLNMEFDPEIHKLIKASSSGSWSKGRSWQDCRFEIDLEAGEQLLRDILNIERLNIAMSDVDRERLDNGCRHSSMHP